MYQYHSKKIHSSVKTTPFLWFFQPMLSTGQNLPSWRQSHRGSLGWWPLGPRHGPLLAKPRHSPTRKSLKHQKKNISRTWLSTRTVGPFSVESVVLGFPELVCWFTSKSSHFWWPLLASWRRIQRPTPQQAESPDVLKKVETWPCHVVATSKPKSNFQKKAPHTYLKRAKKKHHWVIQLSFSPSKHLKKI